jgi:predicted nucleic acid-binding protein
MSKAFLDTNVLAYACDHDTPTKRDTAQRRLRQVASGVAPCISTQVLQEFYVVAEDLQAASPPL